MSLGLKIKVNNMALIKTKQVEGLSGSLSSLNASVNSLETVVNGKVDAADLTALEASVNSLETVTDTNASGISTNAADIDSLEASVTSLEGVTSTNAADIDSLEASVTSLEAVVNDKLEASDLSDLEASVDSLEDVTLTNATGIGENSTNITELVGSVNSLEAVVNDKLEASDLSDLEASVNSLETITGTNASGISTNAADIDSLEASVTSLEGVTSTNTAGIDSLEASVTSLEAVMLEYARDEFASGYTVMIDQRAISNVNDTGSIGQLNIQDAALGLFNLDLNEAIEGTSILEIEQNIIGIYINGVRLTPDEITVNNAATVTCDVQFAIDEQDVLEVKYNRAG